MRRVGAYEAKTHLSRLLDEVEKGETITITRHGVPIAVMAPATTPSLDDRRQLAYALRALRARHPLRGVSIRDLIDEGRR